MMTGTKFVFLISTIWTVHTQFQYHDEDRIILRSIERNFVDFVRLFELQNVYDVLNPNCNVKEFENLMKTKPT